ncbi:MAG TPA: rRNA maturation RNase YbeY [Thermodesulfobacteriota bacterium]|nr:rRNA maturation RNase YbeY [Thermodesulfobacteriota bacterium]
MKILITDSKPYLSSAEKRALKKEMTLILKALNLPSHTEVSISLVDDITMRNLNETYRGIKRTTDVLSFPQYVLNPENVNSAIAHNHKQNFLLGDIIISIETAKRQAKRYKTPTKKEIQRLIIHGTLHLIGHDHKKRKETIAMRKKEKELLSLVQPKQGRL